MDVSRWPLHKIMQLPDWCFGQRWWIGTYVGTAADALTYFTIEDRVPDRFVVWSMIYNGANWTAITGFHLALRLAGKSADTDGFWKSPRLFQQIADETKAYEFFCNGKQGLYLHDMRTAHEARGLRICGAVKHVDETEACENMCAVLISSLPKEVPDWVVSGLAGVR